LFGPPRFTAASTNVPARRLERFSDGWDQHLETVVDIRSITMAEALEEIEAFKTTARCAERGV
jgi:hypothetical protein